MTAPPTVGKTVRDPAAPSRTAAELASIAQEMAAVLERHARGAPIALWHDHSCSVFDAGPRLLQQREGAAVHTAAATHTLRRLIELFGPDIHDGDLFMSNHPYYGGARYSDLMALVPVFCEGEHRFWVAVRARQTNAGEPKPGRIPTNVWQDGFTIPPLRLRDRGRLRRDLVHVYLANVREPDVLGADLESMMAASEAGARRLRALVARDGWHATRERIDSLLDYTDRWAADEVRAIPSGTYAGESWADSDGVGTLGVAVRATLTVEGDTVSIDLAGSSPQVDGYINGSVAITEASAAIPVLEALDSGLPRNHASLSRIRVAAPAGTVANPVWPASTWASAAVLADVVSDAVSKALAQGCPERAAAGWGRLQTIGIQGEDRRGGHTRPFAVLLLGGGSGGGARHGRDGTPLAHGARIGGRLPKESVEMTELAHPLLIEKNEMAADSAGAGEWVGAPGVEYRVRPAGGAFTVVLRGFDGCANPPHGLAGGKPGAGGVRYTETGDGQRVVFVNKPGYTVVEEGETFVAVSTGGGGFGHTHERDPELVRQAVMDGLVSGDSALADFGVAVDAATSRAPRAASAAKADEPLCRPATPNAGAPWRRVARERDTLVTEKQPAPLRQGRPIHIR